MHPMADIRDYNTNFDVVYDNGVLLKRRMIGLSLLPGPREWMGQSEMERSAAEASNTETCGHI